MVSLVLFLILAFVAMLIIPVKKEIKIEGKFKELKKETDLFSGRPFFSFCFEDFCKSCLEDWRKTGRKPFSLSLEYSCVGQVRTYARKIGRINPKVGDIVKMIVWKNIIGITIAYYFELSDFAWVSSEDEADRQEAIGEGFDDLEKYRKIRHQKWHEEQIAEFMAENGITHEEAEVFAYLGTFEMRDRMAKRLGKTIKELDEDLQRSLSESRCDQVDGFYLATVFEDTGTIDSEIVEHLNDCSFCNSMFFMGLGHESDRDKIYKELKLDSFHEVEAKTLGITPEELTRRILNNTTLRYGHGVGCYSVKERIIYATTGELPPQSLVHSATCIGCNRMLQADREDVLATGKIGGLAYGFPRISDTQTN